MVTAVDSSILLDVLGGADGYGPASRRALERAGEAGALAVSAAAWAEVRARYSDDAAHEAAMDDLGVQFSPMIVVAAARAGALWRQYRQAGGPRSRVTTDFLIGAHALVQADRLLTRDRGFYRAYFSSLKLLEPEID